MPPKQKPVIINKVSLKKELSPIQIKSGELNRKKELRSTYNIENTPDTWMLPNRLGFFDWVKNNFKYSKEEASNLNACPLFIHQRFIKDFMQFKGPNRGLLLFHSVGTGKTRSSITVAETLMQHMDVMIMLPAALAGNYINEIRKCGNQLFRNEQHWKFAPVSHPQFAKASRLMEDAKVSEDIIKKNGGLWYYVQGKPSNFSSLPLDQRETLEKQLKDMIYNKYKFLHYNGITGKRLKELCDEYPDENPFHNKIIIIDEVHNFISRVIGGKTSSVSKKLYQLLMDAKNTKLVLLSGTPIINNPVELSFLLNLAKGYIYTHCLKFNSAKPFTQADVVKVLEPLNTIDFYTIKHDTSEIQINFLPDNFVFEDKQKYVLKKVDNYVSIDDQVEEIRKQLKTVGVQFTKHKTGIKRDFLLPIDEQVFEQYFVNYDGNVANVIKNPLLLSRRIQGLVSYYDYYSPEDYPELLPIEYVDLHMSDIMFQKYFSVREKEIENERKAMMYSKKKSGSTGDDKQIVSDMKNGVMYRSFSRAFCNFVFPDNITRPFPSSIRDIIKEMDTFDDDDDGMVNGDAVEPDAKKIYTKSLNTALKALTKAHLTTELAELSPKFQAIIGKIQACTGLSLVYSQFRNVEGIGVMSMALDARGYVELKVKRNAKNELELDLKPSDYIKHKYIKFTGNKEESKILLDIFNSEFSQLPPNILDQLREMHPDLMNHMNYRGEVIKVLMITQSGAEGISLKNVREVHVVEPYWNDIRIQQVIGRAIRARSHVALPPKERNVKVFIYKMKLNEKQRQDKLLKSHDNSLTSDEYVYDIAVRKGNITNRLLTIAKNAAVDCHLHKHQTKAECFKPFADITGDNKLAFNPGHVTDDVKDSITHQLVTKVTKKREFVVLGVKNGEKLVYDKESLEVFKETDVISKDFSNVLGKVIAVENGKAKVKWTK